MNYYIGYLFYETELPHCTVTLLATSLHYIALYVCSCIHQCACVYTLRLTGVHVFILSEYINLCTLYMYVLYVHCR